MAIKPTDIDKNTKPNDIHRSNNPSLGELVRNSNNEEAKKIKSEIDELRKKRDKLISEIRNFRRMLNYKKDELAALSKFLETETNKPNQSEINKLKKEKNRLEFKLSTEPRITLETERELIRRINEISNELNSKLRYSGLEKKSRLLKGDIESYSSKIEEKFKELNSMNETFDKMYSDLKRILGIKSDNTHRNGANKSLEQQRKKRQQPVEQEINLEDIAIIKRKVKKNEEVDK